MSKGSAYAPTKAALVTKLSARSGLADVNVSYQAPVKAEDVRGDSGTYETIHFDEAEGEIGVRIFAGNSPLIFDEEFLLVCVIQVLAQENGSQQDADERAGEILYEVHHELAHQGDWDMAALGIGPADFEYVRVIPQRHRMATGFLPAGAGHGARVELGLRVEARRLFIT